jgi:DNA primase
LARNSFKDPRYDALRQQIVTFFESDSHETLDVEAIYRHFSLEEGGNEAQSTLGEILSDSTFVHAGFARADRPVDHARAGWKSIWNKYLQEQLQTDLQQATKLWREDSSDANLRRLLALREQIEKLVSESVEQTLEGREDYFA